jgi:hypothetical protein
MNSSAFSTTIVCAALLLFQTSRVLAAAPSDNLLESINKRGYISDPMMGSKIPCPCTLIGATRDGDAETVFIATKQNTWFGFTCFSIKGGSQKYLCTMKGQVNGGWTF